MATTTAEQPDESLAAVRQAQSPPAPVPRAPRNLLLFSDGTGNSSGKLQKTNVWRLYEALDLGIPGNPAQAEQIAFYDNGVGTSSFKLLAVLGGVFGFGLARNLRNIYKFLCRNYQDGDRIYAFGFSRGAYTIRLLIAMVTAMGVVSYDSEERLDRDAIDIWREYRRTFHCNNWFADLLVAIGRGLVRSFVRCWRGTGRIGPVTRCLLRGQGGLAWDIWRRPLLYGDCVHPDRRTGSWFFEWWRYWLKDAAPAPAWLAAHWRPARWFVARWRVWVGSVAPLPECGPEIEFMGVWDTVAAYGGPIVEITRAIDAWIWPLSMPDYRLSQLVKCARHALSIDDRRDSFQPVLWDEVRLQGARSYAPIARPYSPSRLARRGGEAIPRLQQVWFAGMHADVGGGYPDESLSYVSLAWMIEHAELAGVRVLRDFRRRIFKVRNVYGPIHDSRGGAGAFYRYQPRYINAWLDYARRIDGPGGPSHVRQGTRIYRDPTIDDGRYRHHGFIPANQVLLHRSVEQRLRTATDGYGPINLPSDYRVDDGIAGTRAAGTIAAAPLADLYELGDRIKLRRFWYFASAVIAVLLALKPWWANLWLLWRLNGTVDARTQTQIISVLLGFAVPSFAARWVDAFTADPYITLLFAAMLITTTALGVGHERKMVDVSRDLWDTRFGLRPPPPPMRRDVKLPAHGLWKRLARWWRSSVSWQNLLARVKWQTAPFLLGLAIWLFNTYVVFAAITQVVLVRKEVAAGQCDGRARPAAPLPDNVARTVSIADPCADLGYALKSSTSYRVTIDTGAAGWRDDGVLGSFRASPAGWTDNGWLAVAIQDMSKFFRRVTSAPLFAPIIESRVVYPGSPPRSIYRYGDGVFMRQLAWKRVPGTTKWIASFTTTAFAAAQARDHGERRLFFFVNDAVLPLDWVSCGEGEAGCRTGPRVFAFGPRYRNNVGTATVTIAPLKDDALERRIDERMNLRCPRLVDAAKCRQAFATPANL